MRSVFHTVECHTMNNHAAVAIVNVWCVFAGPQGAPRAADKERVDFKSESQPVWDCLQDRLIHLMVMVIGKWTRPALCLPQEAGSGYSYSSNVHLFTHPTNVGHTMWALHVWRSSASHFPACAVPQHSRQAHTTPCRLCWCHELELMTNQCSSCSYVCTTHSWNDCHWQMSSAAWQYLDM